MLRYCPINLQGQLERGSSVLSGNYGLLSISDTVKKRLDFKAQWFSLSDLWFPYTETCRNRFHGWSCGRSGGNVDDQKILPRVVDRDILVRLKEAQLTNPFCAYPAGREVSDAARFEFNPDIRDVNFRRKDGQSYCMHMVDGGLSYGEDYVEIVNHQVKDDVDI